MSNKKYMLSPMVLVIVLAFVHLSYAKEIKGKVVGVEGKRAKIEYQSEFAPQKGDDMQIGFKLGEDFASVEGEWKIVKVTSDFAWAESESADAGAPEPEYLVIIQSEDPIKRSEIVSDDQRLYQNAEKYERGDGVKKDIAKAIELYRKVGGKWSGRALSRIGDIYSDGLHRASPLGRSAEEYEKDQIKAFKWYLKAAEQGLPTAQKTVGFNYLTGTAVRHNLAEAEKWYRKAEKTWPWKDSKPLDDFANNLISYGPLLYGMTTKEAEQRAVELYRESARKGSKRAQEKLREKGLSW